jgi:hypothetical protein
MGHPFITAKRFEQRTDDPSQRKLDSPSIGSRHRLALRARENTTQRCDADA